MHPQFGQHRTNHPRPAVVPTNPSLSTVKLRVPSNDTAPKWLPKAIKRIGPQTHRESRTAHWQFSVPYSVYSVSLWFKIYFPANRTAAAPLNGSSTARKQASVMETIHAPNGELTYRVIGLAMRVHRHLGPGLLESAYEKCLCYELAQADIPFRSQVPLPIHYNQVSLDCGYIADLLVDNQQSRRFLVYLAPFALLSCCSGSARVPSRSPHARCSRADFPGRGPRPRCPPRPDTFLSVRASRGRRTRM